MFESMIFAAGLGTRLKPITDKKPKALVEINGKSLLEHNINKLIDSGCRHIVINVHHFADQIKEHIDNKKYNADIFISDETSLLLDTGGGLINAKNLFTKTKDILIHNVDILSKIDLLDLEKNHILSEALATLCVSERKTSRYLLFNSNQRLCGWENISNGDKIISNNDDNLIQYGFSGIHIIKPELLSYIKKQDSFPIIPEYLNLAKDYKINSYIHSKEDWIDVGKLDAIPKAEILFK